MRLVTFEYKFTNHVRVSTCGGMDSEYSHSETATTTYAAVIPEDRPEYLNFALALLRRGKVDDKAFELLSTTVTVVNEIIYSPSGRI